MNKTIKSLCPVFMIAEVGCRFAAGIKKPCQIYHDRPALLDELNMTAIVES